MKNVVGALREINHFFVKSSNGWQGIRELLLNTWKASDEKFSTLVKKSTSNNHIQTLPYMIIIISVLF